MNDDPPRKPQAWIQQALPSRHARNCRARRELRGNRFSLQIGCCSCSLPFRRASILIHAALNEFPPISP
ncbi:hypothetical protein I8J29_01730 [Paenibacillus sp. MWE-103]|uniref:Uncharacterized protein n=1 Tax=Paenibacillus artemisiicola TaxID=1172618 RepID=A0ABS3W3L8_9BACL|nr:hypothetical protein [Paenibacillus artemisiicola]MBO7742898.1 hypothetical protein [Paenibacillus artemisiicola]